MRYISCHVLLWMKAIQGQKCKSLKCLSWSLTLPRYKVLVPVYRGNAQGWPVARREECRVGPWGVRGSTTQGGTSPPARDAPADMKTVVPRGYGTALMHASPQSTPHTSTGPLTIYTLVSLKHYSDVIKIKLAFFLIKDFLINVLYIGVLYLPK